MGSNYFNFAKPPSVGLGAGDAFPRWLKSSAVARAMHVGRTPYTVLNQSVETALLSDWLVGVVPLLQTLLDNYQVLIYSGQLDVILGPPGTQRAIDKLKWSGAKAYATAPTRPMYMVPGDSTSDLAGYVRQANATEASHGKKGAAPTFSYVVLRGCGHIVPQDQPERAYEMLRRFLVPMAKLPSPAQEGGNDAGEPVARQQRSHVLALVGEEGHPDIPAGVPRFS